MGAATKLSMARAHETCFICSHILRWADDRRSLEWPPDPMPMDCPMQAFAVLRDSLYFFRCNLLAIAYLCLPLIGLQVLGGYLLESFLGAQRSTWFTWMLILAIYPLYTCALLRYLDARHHGIEPSAQDIWPPALKRVPTFIMLMVMNLLIIALCAGVLFLLSARFILGVPVFTVIAALVAVVFLWLTVRLSLAQPLLVVREITAIKAMQESFALTRQDFWTIPVSMVGAAVPLLLLSMGSFWLQPLHPVAAVLFDIATLFAQLSYTVVAYRLFTVLSNTHPQTPAA